MIWLNKDMAWVRTDDGRLVPFDGHRLAASIERAAHRVGLSEQWLAEAIVAAVNTFACDCLRDQAVAETELVSVVEGVLRAMGYDEVARAYVAARRVEPIDLDALAAQTGTGFELDFFRQLDAALGTAARRGLTELQVCGLRACVMQLRGAQRWSTGCARLADEIVEYVRARLGRMDWPAHSSMRVALTE